MDSKKSLSPAQKTIVGVQFLFVAFGATVLVPLLVGLDPSTALFTAGLGTLIFHLVTKGKVPIFLGSSFAFVAPIIKATELYGLPGMMSGLVAVGAVYGLMSALIKWRGIGFIKTLFPPVVIGPVIIHWFVACRFRCEYGKRELAAGPDRFADGYSGILAREGDDQADPYLLRDHCGVYCRGSLWCD